MAALSCDICGGSLSMDSSGEFAVCDSCGMKHTKERVQTKRLEITGTVKVSNLPTIESLMKRGHFDQVLDIDPEYAPAYVGKLCKSISKPEWAKNDLFTYVVKKEADLARYYKPLDDEENYQNAIRFADETLRSQLDGYNNEIKKRIAELKNKYSFFMIIGGVTYDDKEAKLYMYYDHQIYYVGNLRDGLVFTILRTGKQYRYESSSHRIFGIDLSESLYRSIQQGDIAVITIEEEQERLAELERIEAEEEEQERKAREERERQAEALYQKGKAAYEEGKKSLFSRKKKYQEAADFFHRADHLGHADAREYLDRLKTEGK